MPPTTQVRHMMNVLAFISFFAALSTAQAAEPAYPTRPVRLLVGFAPGGATDAVARIIASKFTDAMGQTWVVDNRGGAGGNLATEIVARANPDGYTVLMSIDSQLTVNPTLYTLSFNAEKDLQPITMVSATDCVLVVHPSVPAKTFKEFVALAKQKPGALNYSSAGLGSSSHLAPELLKNRAGIDLVHIAYKGGGPAGAAVLAGEVQVTMGSLPSLIPFISAGRVRALASTGAKRSKLLPEVPTVDESGFRGFEVTLWYSLLVPASTPKSIADRIRSEALKALHEADATAAMARLGLEPITSTPAELAARIKAESTTWAGILKGARIRAE